MDEHTLLKTKQPSLAWCGVRYLPLPHISALAFLLVLPHLTTSNQLQAGYVPIATSPTPNMEETHFSGDLGFYSETTCGQAAPCPDSGRQHEAVLYTPSVYLGLAHLPLAQHGGAGGTSSAGSGSSGSAPPMSLSTAVCYPDLELIGLLALEWGREQPPSFLARLFRPPRAA